MKAAVLYGNEDIRYTDCECPEVSEKTVKVEVKVSGICGSDVPRVLHNGAHFYPIVLGHEFSGTVVEVGGDVRSVAVGDTVSGVPLIPCMKCADCQNGNYALCRHYSFIGSRQQGSFAQYVVIPEKNAVKFNSTSVSFEMAAMFEPSTVALHGILQSAYRGGGEVAILGMGTIGIFIMQWAKIFGAKHITVFDIDEERLATAKRLGADYTINTMPSDGADSNSNFNSNNKIKDRVMELTNGHGYDYVFEAAGVPFTMYCAFELAASRGSVCFVGTPSKALTFSPALWENLNRKELRLSGSWMSYSAPFPGREWELTAHGFETGQLRLDGGMIFAKYKMSEAAQAFELYKTPGLVKGKILLCN